MTRRSIPAVLTAALAAILVGCAGSGGQAGDEAERAVPATYRDAAGDAGDLPDVRTVEVTSTPGGRITFRVTMGNVAPKTKTAVDLWLDADADPATGNTSFAGADGADYLFSAPVGSRPAGGLFCGVVAEGRGCFAAWSESGWVAASSPSATVTRTPGGVTVSIDRSDLGDTDELNFSVVRGAAPPDPIDRAPGVGTFNYSLALGGPRPEAVSRGDRADKAGGEPKREQTVLRLAAQNYSDTWAEYFADAVERRAGGSIRVDVQDGWRHYELGEQGLIEDARNGDFDLVVAGARAWRSAGVRSFDALVAPFLIDSLALERRVLDSDLVGRMLEGVEPLGLVGLAVLPGELRRPLGITRTLGGPKSYRGARIGIRPSGVARTTFSALGGSAAALPSGPDGLRGFEGAESGAATIAGNSYDSRAKALTANVVLWPRATTIVMNGKAFDKLEPEQQDVLRAAGRDALDRLYAELDDQEREGLATICSRARLALATASPSDRAALRRAVQPVYDELERDELTREAIAEIERLRRGEPRAVAEPLRCPGARLASAGPAALQGRWRTEVTVQDILDAGATRDDIRSGSDGSWLLELDRGRWTVKNVDTGASGRGTYSVAGDKVRVTIGSCKPASACRSGEILEYRWSVYRDRLVLGHVPGRSGWWQFVARPWTRDR
jgi:TRAP-type C4-dicarboxylate transport system substrate-binding protein